jgi:ABC-type dipeptide/oligopeptide/nickel transport system permease component
MGALAARLGRAAFTLFAVASLVFALVHLVPGDPVDVMLGESASPADRQAMRMALGLERPLPVQWLDYLASVARGDLGRSLYSGEPVAAVLAARLPFTLMLAGAALALALLLAVPLGLAAALRPGSGIDHLCSALALSGMAVPNFCLGPVLVIVFSLGLGLLPVSGAGHWQHLVLPAVTLGMALAGLQARMLRASALEVLAEDHVRTARAKGLGGTTLLLHHVLRPAAGPLLTVLGLQVGALLAGTVITETVFDWPGIGRALVQAIERRDYPVLQGLVLFTSAVYVCTNTVTDLLCALFDPRARP